jgi:REP element-mobilizing transposase RayT
MPRHPRVHAQHTTYHIIARGNNGQPIFLDTDDYRKFLFQLLQTKKRYPFVLAAYVLMPNHFHLLIEVKDDATARIMQSLLTAYARYFNQKHERRGHLFQGRYKAILCQKDAYLMELIRYIHLNPVRAGLAGIPGEWQWSGHRDYSGAQHGLIDPSVIAEVFGTGSRGFERYTAFLSDGSGKSYVEEFHPGERNPFLGTDTFQDAVLAKNPVTARKQKKTSLGDILNAVAVTSGVQSGLIRQKIKIQPLAKARAAFIEEAVITQGYPHAEIARYLNCSESYISKIVRTRYKSK